MDVLVLRLMLDGSFFLSIFMPLIVGENMIIKTGLLGILAAWLIWILVIWRKKDLAGIVHDTVVSEVKILAVIQVYEVVIQGFTKWQATCGPSVFTFAVVAILLLRVGRLETGNQQKGRFWGANSVEFLAVIGVALVLSSEMVKKFAWGLLGGFYMKLVLPILMFFLQIMQWILMFLEPLIAALFSGVEFADHEVKVDNRTGQNFLELTGNEALAETPLWVKMVGYAIVAAALAIFFYFLYKKLSGSGSGRDRTIKGEVKKSTLGASEKKTAKKPSIFDEKNVRYYYRKFLSLCKKYGMEPEKDIATSELMMRIAVANLGEEESLEEFTNLYREVRYGGRKDEEPERKNAKALYKKIKDTAESKKD